MKLGLSGFLTRAFINAPLTPLLLLAALVAGAIALVSLPREEEPQISVPMVDILVQANGYKADQAVELVTRPLEDIIKGIDGVEHVYSQTNDDSVMVTARFLVGTDQDVATLRVHEKIRANIGDLPKGIPEPLIVGRGVNDVAIVTLTLSAAPGQANLWSDNGLFQVAEELQHELAKVDNVGAAYLVGGARTRSASSRTPSASRRSASPSTSSSTSSPTPTARFRSAPSAKGARRCPSSPGRRCRASRTSGFCCSRRATAARSM